MTLRDESTASLSLLDALRLQSSVSELSWGYIPSRYSTSRVCGDW